MPHTYIAKAELFRVLGHPARVRILELLREGERGVGDLQAALRARLQRNLSTPQRTPQTRAAENRKEGTSVFYRIKDPRIFQLLETARQLLTSQLAESQALLHDLSAESPRNPLTQSATATQQPSRGLPGKGSSRSKQASSEARSPARARRTNSLVSSDTVPTFAYS